MIKYGIIGLLVVAVLVLANFADPKLTGNLRLGWQKQVMPGKLSAAHAQLATDCAACHTAVMGVEDAKCISCHADNKALLERQPTAFHAVIANCASCHVEHRGANANLRVMDHEALARIGAKMVSGGEGISSNLPPADSLPILSLVARLNCAGCHGTKDKHTGLLGQDCASCHATEQWTIPAFQHPSVRSLECAQCHQAPPSHYMMHFEMVSKNIAARSEKNGKGCCEGVVVSQCYSCHKTTSWNDIQGVGFYKHH
ncbi:MAG: cytochrome c3 family protein [Saprospiraceae bacterium]|nr:cytochrome c3 family protein [Saprospiraceae bacterium]